MQPAISGEEIETGIKSLEILVLRNTLFFNAQASSGQLWCSLMCNKYENLKLLDKIWYSVLVLFVHTSTLLCIFDCRLLGRTDEFAHRDDVLTVLTLNDIS